MRYLWDVFDNRNDCVGDDYSASQSNFWRHMSNTYYYPNGIGLNQIDEPWATNGLSWYLNERDGRGAVSSVANYASVRDTETLRLRNCAPP